MSNEIKVFTYWEDPIGETTPPYIRLCMESGKRFCKNYTILNLENINQYIDDKDLHPNWRKLPHIAQRADCVRVAIIHKYGGLWTDADTVFIRPISLLLEYIDNTKEFAFLQWSDGRILNGYFYGIAGSMITQKWLARINASLVNLNNVQWTSFGEAILTPLVLWECKEKTQKLNRETFLPINFDRIPHVFFEDVNYRMFVKQNTVAVGLNHSWLVNVCPKIKNMMSTEIARGPAVLNQILRDAVYGYCLTPYDVAINEMTRYYSYGSVSIGDIDVLVTAVGGLDTVIELGTNQGTTTRLLSKCCKKVITVDVFEDLDQIHDTEWKDEYKKNFNNNPHSCDKISGYLSDCPNVNVVKSETSVYLKTVADNSIDAIFVDDDHSYNGVDRVYKIAIDKVKIGGLLLFHDCNMLHNDVNRYYIDVISKDERLEEIEYIPTTFYTSIKTFRRVK